MNFMRGVRSTVELNKLQVQVLYLQVARDEHETLFDVYEQRFIDRNQCLTRDIIKVSPEIYFINIQIEKNKLKKVIEKQ